MSRDVGTRRYISSDPRYGIPQSIVRPISTHPTSPPLHTHGRILQDFDSRPEKTNTGPANSFLPKMPSLRSILGASTSTLRQSILSRPQPFFARSFSQLSRLSLASGLRGLRSRLQQSQNAGNGTVPAGAAAAGVRQLEQVRGMKTRSSVKRLCDGCKV